MSNTLDEASGVGLTSITRLNGPFGMPNEGKSMASAIQRHTAPVIMLLSTQSILRGCQSA
jgi:hypothetical protein